MNVTALFKSWFLWNIPFQGGMIVQHTNLDFQKQNFGAQVEMYFGFSVMHIGWEVVLKVLQCPSTWQDQGGFSRNWPVIIMDKHTVSRIAGFTKEDKTNVRKIFYINKLKPIWSWKKCWSYKWTNFSFANRKSCVDRHYTSNSPFTTTLQLRHGRLTSRYHP